MPMMNRIMDRKPNKTGATTSGKSMDSEVTYAQMISAVGEVVGVRLEAGCSVVTELGKLIVRDIGDAS